MDLQLMNLRIAAGYPKRPQFAEAYGINVYTLKDWESGKTKLKFEEASDLADFLGCTLDELAGKKPPLPDYGSRQANRLMEDFQALSEEGKTAAANAVHGIRMGEEYAGEKGISSPSLSA